MNAISSRTHAIVSLLVCASVLFGAVLSASRAKLIQDERNFEHYDHIPVRWFDPAYPEVLRDCTGCHATDAPGEIPVSTLCEQCHYKNQVNQSSFQASASWTRLPTEENYESMGLFQHGEHSRLTCRECHAPEGYPGGRPAEFYPEKTTMVIRRGLAECQRCHANDEPSYNEAQPFRSTNVEAVQSSRFFDGINADASMGPPLGEFLHTDHILGPVDSPGLKELLSSPDRPVSCAECHVGLLSSSSKDQSPDQFLELASCERCHIKQGNVPLEFADQSQNIQSLTSNTFFHGDHLRQNWSQTGDGPIASDGAQARIEAGGCGACHDANQTFSLPDISFRGPSAPFTYEGCIECHNSQGWMTKDHGNWASCLDCHTFSGPPADLLKDRPTANNIIRRRPKSFRVETQVHRMITGASKDDLAQACTECHRAPVGELPSQIRDEPFNHDTHLPRDPKPSDCERCHASRLTRAETSLQLSGFLDGRMLERKDKAFGLTYDPAACATCHEGSELTAQFDEDQESQVTEFSHADHLGVERTVGSKTVSISCESCHLPWPEGEGSKATTFFQKPSACSSCHDHKENSDITAQLGGTDATSCVLCHSGGVPVLGLPDRNLVGNVRQRIASIDGSQYHPQQRACEECHLDVSPSTVSLPLGLVQVVGGNNPSNMKSDVHNGAYPLESQASCLSCHWAVIKVSNMPEDQDPAKREVRERFGNQIGGSAPDFFPGWLDAK